MISTRSGVLVIDTVVCLTLAKWETVSGRFGGYLRPSAMAGVVWCRTFGDSVSWTRHRLPASGLGNRPAPVADKERSANAQNDFAAIYQPAAAVRLSFTLRPGPRAAARTPFWDNSQAIGPGNRPKVADSR